ncbi:DUF1553 domain-containing protein [Schlesneria sp. T3-172]|uniref:DUF1553 domain-containing protein n=1 Tax=Schlesneria sphaerica TaxID=3373610 RepID=UPI0037CB7FF4
MLFRLLLALLVSTVYGMKPVFSADALSVIPREVVLKGNFAQTQLLVTHPGAEATRAADLTSQAEFATSNEQVAVVTAAGRVIPRGDGTATITVKVGERVQSVNVVVTDVVAEPVVNYLEQVRPALYKAGCNMGACHAAQHGQGGFKLSVFGFDPAEDRTAMVREAVGRRVNLLEPTASLLLQKPTMQIPHGGGRRLDRGSRDYEMLVAWIRGGAPGPGTERPVSRLIVTPAQRNGEPGLTQQLRVEAVYSDGQTRDVTAWAKFDSMDEGLVNVSREGFCKVTGRGQAPVMVRFEGQAEIAMFVIPYGPPAQLEGWVDHNAIDTLAANKFRELGIEPSPLCDDTTFLRRIFLDATGTLPTRAEIEEFLASANDTTSVLERRTHWIDRVLGLVDSPRRGLYTERYAAYWTLKWSDLLRNSSRELQETGMWALHNWIKGAFRANVPFDKFVSELVQGKGSSYSNGPANYFIVNSTPQVLAESTSQLFLGTRLTCAQCHHHPFEKYSQDDYYSFAAFFARTGLKSSQEFGLFGLERVVVIRTGGEVHQPRTGQRMAPKPLDAGPVDHPLDRRIALAQWMTSPKNAAFSRATVNRYVGFLLGRGLVEPVDDLRASNPPTNPALLQLLADDFVAHNFDLKHLIRTIMVSRLYQLDSQPTPQNVADSRFYSHFEVKRLAAEPLLDAIDDAAGTQTKFQSLPLGTRAIEIPDAEYPDYFLNTFAKPRRVSVCECERSPDANLAQALHTLNGDVIATKIAASTGRVEKLLSEKKSHAEIVTDLYFATLSRPPSSAELSATERLLTEYTTPKECYEDLLWALINSKGFLFVR